MSANKPYNRIENPYLKLGFWEFLAFSTLIIFLFPWSIIFCLIYYGFEETKLILLALIEDFAKTLLAIVIVVLSLIIIIITVDLFSRNLPILVNILYNLLLF